MLYNYKELFKIMEKVVADNVEAYQADFYEYDTETLKEMETGTPYVWIVRRLGTHLTADPEKCESITKCWEPLVIAIITRHGYTSTKYEIKFVTRDDLTKWIKERNTYYLTEIQNKLHDRTVFDTSEYVNGKLSYSFGYVYCSCFGTVAYNDTLENISEVIGDTFKMTPYSFLTCAKTYKDYEIA